jgi:hypothetical protein
MEHHMAIEKDLLDQLLAGRDPKDVFNPYFPDEPLNWPALIPFEL